MWEMVRNGLGVGILDSRLGDSEPGVERASTMAFDMLFPIWLVAHRDILSNARLRLVYDFLATELKQPIA